jgi:hypothetical protein
LWWNGGEILLAHNQRTAKQVTNSAAISLQKNKKEITSEHSEASIPSLLSPHSPSPFTSFHLHAPLSTQIIHHTKANIPLITITNYS